MVEEDLAKMDFSKGWEIVVDCSTQLKAKGVNHFLICELTDAGGTFSKYHHANWMNLPDSQEIGSVLEGVNKELTENHLGGIVAVVFDLFASQFYSNFNRRPNFEELTDIMLHFHKIYLNNIQPK